jgi:hypothetical protein
MESVRILVAIRDWCASRNVVSVILTGLGSVSLPPLYIGLNLGVERFSEAVLIHLGFENALASMVILWKH